ncbi:hypothetical protein [Streptomyces fodineus]|uniref:hypothetical protein n=1 Tax=Streptomyces fodineus TaxID=1904616 RepID=UPI000B1A3BE3
MSAVSAPPPAAWLRLASEPVVEAFVHDAKKCEPFGSGFHNWNYAVPLTGPMARLLGREPGTRVTVRVRQDDVLPVVIRTWQDEAEILRAVQRVLPHVPECLVAGAGFAIHSYVEGVPLSEVRGAGRPLERSLIRELADLLARTATVRSAKALPPLPVFWPRNHTDSQGFLHTLVQMADLQIRQPNWRRFGGCSTNSAYPRTPSSGWPSGSRR